MASFNIDTKAHSSARKQNRIAAMKDSPNENERKVADKKLRPSMKRKRHEDALRRDGRGCCQVPQGEPQGVGVFCSVYV